MTNKEYALSLFNQWNDKLLNDSELINGLLIFQSNFSNCELWFRFFKGDSLATSINDIERDLQSNINRHYIVDCIKELKNDSKYFELNFDYYA